MKSLNVAVIGLGVMGQQHARIYSELPNVNLVAVHDVYHELAENVAKTYHASAVKDVKDIFANPEIDAVSICTPDSLHYEYASLACEYKKHVLIEKPLADKLEEAKGIVDKVKESGIKMMVGHTLRWDPRYYLAKQQMSDGKIGAPLHLVARRSNSYENGKRLKGRTSLPMFLGVHDIDAIEWITGDKIVEVYAVEVKKRLQEWNVSDAVIVTLRLQSGAIGSYETSWALPEGFADLDSLLEIVGTEGVIKVNIQNQNIFVYNNDKRVIYPDTMYGVDLYGNQTGILKEEISSFVSCILEDKPFPISIEEAYRAVHIVHCIEESMKSRKPVTVDKEFL